MSSSASTRSPTAARWRKTPAAQAANVTEALSVSNSQISSPTETWAPSGTSQRASTADSRSTEAMYPRRASNRVRPAADRADDELVDPVREQPRGQQAEEPRAGRAAFEFVERA